MKYFSNKQFFCFVSNVKTFSPVSSFLHLKLPNKSVKIYNWINRTINWKWLMMICLYKIVFEKKKKIKCLSSIFIMSFHRPLNQKKKIKRLFFKTDTKREFKKFQLLHHKH